MIQLTQGEGTELIVSGTMQKDCKLDAIKEVGVKRSMFEELHSV